MGVKKDEYTAHIRMKCFHARYHLHPLNPLLSFKIIEGVYVMEISHTGYEDESQTCGMKHAFFPHFYQHNSTEIIKLFSTTINRHSSLS